MIDRTRISSISGCVAVPYLADCASKLRHEIVQPQRHGDAEVASRTAERNIELELGSMARIVLVDHWMKIAFLVDDMFEDSEFRVPYDRLHAAGHQVEILGLERGKSVEGKKHEERIKVERAVSEVSARDYDALVIPGGYSPDRLRVNADAVRFTKEMAEREKPIAAVCHAPWMLIEAGLVKGRSITSWPSLKTDLINAGARWVDKEVVVDGNLITSRKPDDLEAFSKALLQMLTQGVPERAAASDRATLH